MIKLKCQKKLKDNYSITSIEYLNELIDHENTKLKSIILEIDNMYLSEKLKIFKLDNNI